MSHQPSSPVPDDALPLLPDPRASVEQAVRVLWRRRWRLLLVFLPVLAIGLFSLLILPERFTAHATLIVGFRQPELATVDPGRDPSRGEPDIDGAIELMKSPEAMRQVAATLAEEGRTEFASVPPASSSSLGRLRRFAAGLLGHTAAPMPQPRFQAAADAGAARLRGGFRIERVGRSTLVSVSFTSSDPTLAAQAANALAAFSANDETFLSRMSLAERSGFQIMKTSVTSAAAVPEEPSSPNAALIAGASLLVALGAALTAVLFGEYRAQQTVLSTEEVSRRGMRALGLIPAYRFATERGLAFDHSVDSLQATLATLPRRRAEGGAVLLFTSALPEEGKSTTIAALAGSLAGAGRKVLLVDADLRSPSLHRTFGLTRSPGLATCFREGACMGDLIQLDPATGVHVLTAGEPVRNPLKVLTSAAFCGKLDDWREAFDLVLIDSPPILPVGDACLLAACADYTVVVARWNKTSWVALNRALRRIPESGGRIAGVTLSRVNVRKLARYSYADAEVYGRAYGGHAHAQEN